MQAGMGVFTYIDWLTRGQESWASQEGGDDREGPGERGKGQMDGPLRLAAHPSLKPNPSTLPPRHKDGAQ